VSPIDVLNDLWTGILRILEQFVIPDWGALIELLPVFIFLGVVGPLVTFLVLGTFLYQVAKPRASVTFVEGPQVAPIGEDGQPVFPAGLPYCRRDGLIFSSGTTHCDRDAAELTVTCPMCGLGRLAIIDTCSNCGLVLRVRPRIMAVRPASGPTPGGAAAA
jgi:hypothetical protein